MYKMAILSKIKSHSDASNYFKELRFYNKPIESITKTDQAFKGYAMSYKVEIIEKNIQLYN